MNMTAPIKCLDLDDSSGQIKREGWLYIFIPFSIKKCHFIDNLGGGIILLVI